MLQWTHSAYQRLDDFVTPELAAFLAVQLEFELSLEACGLPVPTLLPDWRIDEDEEDWSLCGDEGSWEVRGFVPRDPCVGARTDMDSHSPVEPHGDDQGWHTPPTTSDPSFSQSWAAEGDEADVVHIEGRCTATASCFHRQESFVSRPPLSLQRSFLKHVAFSFSVQFWFPVEHQLALPPPSASPFRSDQGRPAAPLVLRSRLPGVSEVMCTAPGSR